MSYDDLGKVEYLPFAELVELMKNRQLDATLQSAGLGVASIRDLATSLPINVVAVPAETVAKIGAPYVAATIPAGTYEGQTEDVPTAAVGNFLVTHDGVSDETVYQMTKLLFENLDARSPPPTPPPRRSSRRRRSNGMPMPLHPGAERYYREAGAAELTAMPRATPRPTIEGLPRRLRPRPRRPGRRSASPSPSRPSSSGPPPTARCRARSCAPCMSASCCCSASRCSPTCAPRSAAGRALVLDARRCSASRTGLYNWVFYDRPDPPRRLPRPRPTSSSAPC